MRCLIAPDSFKGSLLAEEVAAAMAEGLRQVLPSVEVDLCPMADGGEGTLQALLAAGVGRMQMARVADAAGAERVVCWLRAGDLAVIEVAEVVGLPDAGDTALANRQTVGVGQLLRQVLEAGCTRIAVALGGSSTNDGGAGLLAGLGGVWRDRDGQPLPPLPYYWPEEVHFDATALDPQLERVSIDVWTDVNSPLLGAEGASAVFGPQKGMQATQWPAFEAALGKVASALLATGRPMALDAPGGGAAGGLGFALLWLGGRQLPGAEAVAHAANLPQRIAVADWVITGEGRSDGQTLAGKTPAKVALLAREAGVPVSLLSGSLVHDEALLALFDGCFSLCPGPVSLPEAMQQAKPWLARAAGQMLRLRLAARRGHADA